MADSFLLPRLHPEFPGPIGKPNAGKLSRFSFIGVDGRRQYHRRALATFHKPEIERSIVGEKAGAK